MIAKFKFHDLDMFGEPFAYNVTQKISAFQTKTGAFFSVIFIALLSLFAYFFFSEYTDTTAPRIIIRKETLNTYPKINLSEEKFIAAAFMQSQTKMLHVSELDKYLTGFVTKYEQRINEQTGKVETVVKATQKIIDSRLTQNGEDDLRGELDKAGALSYYDRGLVYAPEDTGSSASRDF